jgi:hypothetical protein
MNHKTKYNFSEEDYLLFIKRHTEGETLSSIARSIKVSNSTIQNIFKKRNIPVIRWNYPSSKKYKYNEDYFENIDTEIKAYLLGFIYADGCVYKDRLTIAISNIDIEILKLFQVEICKDCPIRDKILKKETHNNQVTFRVASKKLCKDLLTHGVMPNKSFKIRFPSHISKSLYPHFIRGYFDGDGCVYTKISSERRIINVHISSNIDFLTDIVNTLPEIEIKIHKNGNIFRSHIRSFCSTYMFYTYMYSSSSFFLNRKKKKFEEFFNCVISNGQKELLFKKRNTFKKS